MNEFCPTVLEKRFMHILAFIRGIFAQVALLREKYIRESFAYGEITQKNIFSYANELNVVK